MDQKQRPDLRRRAVSILGSIGPSAKDATSAVKAALKDPDAQVRARAASAHLNISPADEAVALQALIEGLKVKDQSAKTNAVMALAALGPKAKAAVPALEQVQKQGGMAGYYARSALNQIKGGQRQGQPASGAPHGH